MATKISVLHFNKSTLSYPKCPRKDFRNSVSRRADVLNDCGFHDFTFVLGYSYRAASYAIYIDCLDEFGTTHHMTMFADHPDYEFLKNYITEP